MPFVVPVLGAIGAAAAATIGVTLAVTSLAAVVIGGIIVVGAALLIATSLKQPGFSDPGQLINKNSNNAPIPVVYGNRRVGATRTFIRSGGAEGENTSNEYLHIVYTICEGPVESIDEIYLNDLVVWRADAVGGGVDGFNDDGIATAAGDDEINFTGLIEINNHLGEENQVADPLLVSRFPVDWSANHRGAGIVYSYIRFKYSRNAYSGLPTVTFQVRGRKTRDVLNLAAPEAYNTNPANVLYDYLSHPVYGRAFGDELLELTSFQDSRDYYNTNHTFLGEARYTANGALATDDNTYNNTQKILASCNSALVFTGGKYVLIPFKQQNSVDDINETHIIDKWSMSLGDKSGRFNTMRVRFTNAEDNYQQGTIMIQDPDMLAADNGLTLQKEIGLDLVVDPTRAKLVGYELMKQSRFQTTVDLVVPHTKQTIEPMDVINIDLPWLPDDVATQFRVIDVTLRPDGSLRLRAQEYNATVYTDEDPGLI